MVAMVVMGIIIPWNFEQRRASEKLISRAKWTVRVMRFGFRGTLAGLDMDLTRTP